MMVWFDCDGDNFDENGNIMIWQIMIRHVDADRMLIDASSLATFNNFVNRKKQQPILRFSHRSSTQT